jgi:hypothetical protein
MVSKIAYNTIETSKKLVGGACFAPPTSENFEHLDEVYGKERHSLARVDITP